MGREREKDRRDCCVGRHYLLVSNSIIVYTTISHARAWCLQPSPTADSLPLICYADLYGYNLASRQVGGSLRFRIRDHELIDERALYVP